MKNNTRTIVTDDNIAISNLTGHLTNFDVDTWYEEFKKVCFGFIDNGKPYRLLLNRTPYTVAITVFDCIGDKNSSMARSLHRMKHLR